MKNLNEYTHPITEEDYERFRLSWKEDDPIPNSIREYVLHKHYENFKESVIEIHKILGLNK